MTRPNVTVADYGMGNIRSISKALERSGANVTLARDGLELARADRVVVPGQGAFGQAAERLRAAEMAEPLRELVHRERPLLGVCLGLQILYASSDEAPGCPGLGLVPGHVELLPAGPALKRPHMGWAPTTSHAEHPVLAANPDGTPFYFVHSFAAFEAPGFHTTAATHGRTFVAALGRGPLVATQFHPEKSQEAGARLLDAWLAI